MIEKNRSKGISDEEIEEEENIEEKENMKKRNKKSAREKIMNLRCSK